MFKTKFFNFFLILGGKNKKKKKVKKKGFKMIFLPNLFNNFVKKFIADSLIINLIRNCFQVAYEDFNGLALQHGLNSFYPKFLTETSRFVPSPLANARANHSERIASNTLGNSFTPSLPLKCPLLCSIAVFAPNLFSKSFLFSCGTTSSLSENTAKNLLVCCFTFSKSIGVSSHGWAISFSSSVFKFINVNQPAAKTAPPTFLSAVRLSKYRRIV